MLDTFEQVWRLEAILKGQNWNRKEVGKIMFLSMWKNLRVFVWDKDTRKFEQNNNMILSYNHFGC